MEKHYVCSFAEALENSPLSCTPSPTPSHFFFLLSIPKFTFLRSEVCTLLLCNPHSPPDLDHHYVMVPTAKAALYYHLPQQLLLVIDQQVQLCLVPSWPLKDLYDKVIPDTLQKSSWQLVCCCISLTANVREDEVPQENQGR